MILEYCIYAVYLEMKLEKRVNGRGAQIHIPNNFELQSRTVWIEDVETDEEKVALLFDQSPANYLEIFPKTIINKVDSPDLPLERSMNPYQGCEHGCVYCYARNSHEYWGYDAGLGFEQNILVKKSAPELLRKELSHPSWIPQTIMFAGNTDIYQPIEKKLGLTRKLLQILVEFKNPVGIITKNSLIERDIDILKEMSAQKLVNVNLSLTTLNEKIKKKLEPRTSSAHSILKTIEKLATNGIPVYLFMAPIIPGLTDHEIFEIAEHSSNAGALDMHIQLIRLNGHNGLIFTDWIKKTFPEKAERVLHRIEDIHGGKLNESRYGLRLSGSGKVAEIIHQQVDIARNKYFNCPNRQPLRTDLFLVPGRGKQTELFN